MSMDTRSFRRARAALATLMLTLLAAAGLVAVSVPAQALAYDADRFDAGNIISDVLFYDGGAMTAREIQAFLDSKVSTCSPTAAEPCLKDFVGTIEQRAEDARCDAIEERAGATAAQMIEAVALACDISPKVLLVTLEKEQGFVTSKSPTTRMYQIAMGFGCPDTAPCEEAYYGLFTQLYKAGNQFQRYRVEYTRYRFRAGGTYDIGYSPSSSCGAKRVTVANWATAALYNYTPYTPNDAALANYPGTAPCGSYGNRNFFAIYGIWFGSTIAEGSLLKTEQYSSQWLIVGDKRYRIHGDDERLLATVAPLGPVVTVSMDYLTTFENAGPFSGVVKNPQGTYFILDGMNRHTVRTCEQLTDMGFACGAAPELTWDQVKAYGVAGDFTGHLRLPDGTQMKLEGGLKHEILDAESALAAGLDPAAAVDFGREGVVASVPWGAPVVQENAVFTRDGADLAYVKRADGLYAIPAALLAETGIAEWLGGVRGDLDIESVRLLKPITDIPASFTSQYGTAAYVFTPDGFARLDDPAPWDAFHPLDNGFRQLLPAVDNLAVPSIVARADGTGLVHVGTDGIGRLLDPTHAALLENAAAGTIPRRTVVTEALAPFAAAPPVLPSGAVVRIRGTGAKWLIDGPTRRLVSWNVLRHTTPYGLVDIDAAYAPLLPEEGQALAMGVLCGDDYYVQVDGRLHPVAWGAVQHYRGDSFAFSALGQQACAALPHHPKEVGRLLVSDGQYWIMRDGLRTAITQEQYAQWSTRYGPAKIVGPSFLALIAVAPE